MARLGKERPASDQRRTPGIPVPQAELESLRATCEALRECCEVLLRDRVSAADSSAILVRDLASIYDELDRHFDARYDQRYARKP
jgi:hypothetical protein